MRQLSILKNNQGQMTVELAVCIPVLLMLAAIAYNVLGYLEVCARFDRAAAEAVRIEAASPGYGAYGSQVRAERVRSLISQSFAQRDNVQIDVSVAPAGGDSGSSGAAAVFAFPTRLETYTCTLHYQPPGFGRKVFGVQAFDLEHSGHYTIDPFRPGVVA